MPAPDPTQPGPEGQGSAPGADIGQIAADTARESAQAVPHPSGQAPAAPQSEPRDLEGRTFDPALHAVKADGTPRLRRGLTLIRLKGAPVARPTAPPPPPSNTYTPGRGYLDLEAAGLGTEPAADGSETPLPRAAVQQAVEDAQLAGSVAAKQKSDAEIIAESVEALCRLIASEKGELSPEHQARLEARWADAMADNGWALPIGKLTLAVWESGRNVWRAGTTPEGRDRVAKAWDWLMGKPKRPRQDKPTRPAAEGDADTPPKADAPAKAKEERFERSDRKPEPLSEDISI